MISRSLLPSRENAPLVASGWSWRIPAQRDSSGVALSIVIPLYNESENLHPLYVGICDAIEPTCKAFEIIFVDDGSDDETLKVLKTFVDNDARVRVLSLRKNFGQTVALKAGIEHARGGIIVTMDGDLQNDARDIPALVSKIEEGYDLVTGWRRDRKDPFVSRKLPSMIANWIIAKVSGVPFHDTGCSLKAYRAELIGRVPLYSDLHRFIPAMSRLEASRCAEVVVRHHPRRYGKSKYGLSRTGRVVLDLITVKMLISFSRRPLQWYGCWSIPCFMLSAMAGLYAITAIFISNESTFVLPVVAVLMAFLAVNLLVTGILGELIISTKPFPRAKPLAHCYHVASKCVTD